MDLRFVPFLNIIIHRENPISKNLNEGEIRNENMLMLDTGRAKVFIAPDRTRTCNPQIRSLVPYPLGHRSSLVKEKGLQMTVSELFIIHRENPISKNLNEGEMRIC